MDDERTQRAKMYLLQKKNESQWLINRTLYGHNSMVLKKVKMEVRRGAKEQEYQGI